MGYVLLDNDIAGYRSALIDGEKSAATIEKYLRDVRVFLEFLEPGQEVDKDTVLRYKERLTERYAVRSVNSMLAALNSYLSFLGWEGLRVKPLKFQRRIFCAREDELTREEYLALVTAAKRRKDGRLELLLQTLCSTGIRVSELPFITVEAARAGMTTVRCKGKIRTIFLPRRLCSHLLRYARARGIAGGCVFVTRSGRPLHRSNIWLAMKRLCASARVMARKVYPHNLRHLFARTYYHIKKDLARLADLLGHSSVDTTRVYLITTGEEEQKQVNQLRLVL